MKKHRYLFVTTHFKPDLHYGGVVESSTKLFKYLSKLDDFRLACVSQNPDRVKNGIKGRGNCYRTLIFHRFGFSLQAILGIWKDMGQADVVLVYGIFTFPVTLAQFYSLIRRKPFIVAVHGGLQPWSVAHKKWKKYFYIKYITLPLMRMAKYILVTSSMEEETIRKLGFDNTIMIPNGVDVEDFQELPGKYSFHNKYKGKFVFLFISRMAKEKGLDMLVQAYRQFCTKISSSLHILLLVGPDSRGYLKSMRIDFEKENIQYLNGIYGREKIILIRAADVIILPSYSENFGNIVTEALVCERPVITTTGTPWQDIEKVGCGYYIKPDPGELLDAMEQIFSTNKEELHSMGARGREYVLKNFNWDTSAKKLYSYLQKIS